MTTRILFVDDEPNVLAGVQRMFRKDFQIDTASGGAEGLGLVRQGGPYAVVVSDMRMPRMNGAEFLAQVRELSPESIRMVLTGETDIASAVRAVNEGSVFRFLVKPCPEPTMRAAMEAALRQYQLQTAERELLEQTLRGSVKVLSEILSLANPVAFGRSVRIQRYVRHIVEKLELREDAWQFEVAAMLSQIGCIAIPPATLEAIHANRALPDAERQQYLMHASVAHDLLIHVPRLANVASMICRQYDTVRDGAADLVTLGAQILKVCVAFDQRLARSNGSIDAALSALRMRPDVYRPDLVNALLDLRFDGASRQAQVISLARLEPGMIIDEDVRTNVGLLLVGKGQETTEAMLIRLRNFHQSGAIGNTVRVLMFPPEMASTAGSNPNH